VEHPSFELVVNATRHTIVAAVTETEKLTTVDEWNEADDDVLSGHGLDEQEGASLPWTMIAVSEMKLEHDVVVVLRE